MKKILFLDDDEQRHTSFKHANRGLWPEGHTIVHVRTADEAIDELKQGGISQAFLDHDLSEEDVMSVVGASTRCPTGMDVADHICAMASPPDVVVHSMNGPAAKEMVRRLRDAGVSARWLAFPWLIAALSQAAPRG